MEALSANSKLTIEDFYAVSVIGKGYQAKVLLARKKSDGQLYALKIIKKDLAEKRGQEKNVIVERNVLYEV